MSIDGSQGIGQSQMLRDLQVLMDNAARLSDIVNVEILSAASASTFAHKAAEALDLPESVVNDVLNALWRAKQYQKNQELDPHEAVEDLNKQLDSEETREWKASHIDSWTRCSQVLGDILETIDEDHALLIAIKANRLAYTHQNLLVRSQLLTDIRPVFDSTAEELRELVVTHTLFITYSDDSQTPRMISFAVDADDIAHLLSECQRAATKTKTVKNALRQFNPIVLPERDNEHES